MIYFDNAASTVTLQCVAEKMNDILFHTYANPASMSILGLQAEKEIRTAAEILGNSIHCNVNEVYFTSGGSESDTWAIAGTAMGYCRSGKHLITTKIEHPAVSQSMKSLEEQGFEITWLDVDKKGYIDLEQLKQSIRKDTILVSTILINNEIGTIQDAQTIGTIIKESNPNTLYHVDAVQAFGKYPIDVRKMKIDMLSMSGHKIHAPKGLGMLYIKDGLKVKPLIYGGGQQRGKRAGTENTAGAAALALAAKESIANLEEAEKKVFEVKKVLAEGILNNIEDTQINGECLEKASPYVLNISFKGLRSEVLLHALEQKEIFVSAGSACDSRKKTASSVLQALGLSFEEIEGAIRFSFSRFNTVEEAEQCVEVLKEIVPALRKYNKMKK